MAAIVKHLELDPSRGILVGGKDFRLMWISFEGRWRRWIFRRRGGFMSDVHDLIGQQFS
jgi:hypothetical protein